MRRSVLAIGWIICGAAVSVVRAEEVRGQLHITRALTRQRVALPAYDVRGIAPNVRQKTVNEWERVAVYLEGVNAPKAARITATINQKGQRFEPEIVVVPVGSAISFPNSDPIFHNVFSLSKAKGFDLGFYPAGEARTVNFDKPGVVQVYCHLHSDMNAAILVVPNAWYTQPDNQGTFKFSGIPPGVYQVVVWHKSAGFFRKEIRIPEEGTANVSMEIPLETAGVRQ